MTDYPVIKRADMSRHVQCWPSTDAGSPSSHICPLRLRKLYHHCCRRRMLDWDLPLAVFLRHFQVNSGLSPQAGEQIGPMWIRPFHPWHQGYNKEEMEGKCEIFYLEGKGPCDSYRLCFMTGALKGWWKCASVSFNGVWLACFISTLP